jgi:hypothetical protein
LIGGIIGWTLDDKLQLGWKWQLALYLVPTIIYGLMFLGQKYPKSEASKKGMSLGDMFKAVGSLGGLVICYLLALFFGGLFTQVLASADATPEQALATAKTAKIIGYVIGFVLLLVIGIITKFSMGSVLLFVLFIAHALVGAVELGTDGWIQNITGNLFTSEAGKWLFVFTSAIMFGLRFCAHWLEKTLKLSPVSMLFACAVLAFVGLQLAGESLRVFSNQCAQKRRPNMIAEVKTKSHLPASEVKRLPVIFWIHPSVPSSTAPTRAWAMNKTKSRTDPMENLVMIPITSSRTNPMTYPIILAVLAVANACSGVASALASTWVNNPPKKRARR